MLSLWVYSLISKTPEQNQRRAAGETTGSQGSTSGESSTRSGVGVQIGTNDTPQREVGFPSPAGLGQHMRYARIVSSESHADSHWAQQARRWIGRGVTIVAAAAPNGAHFRMRTDIEPWPVFGLAFLTDV